MFVVMYVGADNNRNYTLKLLDQYKLLRVIFGEIEMFGSSGHRCMITRRSQ